MKKIIISVLALAALTGASVASERDHDSRLSDQSYIQSGNQGSVDPFLQVNTFSAQSLNVSVLDSAELRRLEEKNGSKG